LGRYGTRTVMTLNERGITLVEVLVAAGIIGIGLVGLLTVVPISSYAVFSQTEMWLLLALVKGSRFQSLQRSRKVMPASRAIRSSSDGHT